MKDYKGSPALDAGLIAAAQAVEHYEISRYGTLRTWAEEFGLNDAVSLLQETLDEEKAADEKLSGLADDGINQEAAGANHPSENGGDAPRVVSKKAPSKRATKPARR